MSHVAPEPYRLDPAGFAMAPPPRRTGRRRVWWSVVLVLVVGGLSATGFLNHQRIVDQFSVWGFGESSVIKSYVARSTMSGEGEFLFLASKPRVASATTFNSICAKKDPAFSAATCRT